MQRSFDRRKFLKLSAAGAAGGLLTAAGPLRAATTHGKSLTAENGIIYRTLGKTGIKLPLVNLGFVRSDNPRIVNLALDMGMTLIDTAHGYNNGRNEEMLGQVLKNRDRDSYYIATRLRGDTEEQIMEAFETSLGRLGLDYVDMLGLHASASREHTLDETRLKAFSKIKEQGKARFLTVSTHSNEPEVIRAVADSGVYDVVFTAYNFRMEHFNEINEAIDYAAAAGTGIIAMKTMAGAYWDRERKDPINVKAALKYVFQNPNIHSSIPGMDTFQELEENFEVNHDIGLTPDELRDLRIDQADTGMFCLGCEKCADQCIRDLPVNEIMRSYMYAYGYSRTALARETMDKLEIDGDACANCDSCNVKCIQGFDVAEKIRDIDRIRMVPREFLTG
ncbi:MAG: oxidoreductase [Marinilabiliales bacterium]|nr:MAG: oxidoreductase [Marinilabiliales bacterium]